MCPRCSYPFYIVSYYIKTNSWTYSRITVCYNTKQEFNFDRSRGTRGVDEGVNKGSRNKVFKALPPPRPPLGGRATKKDFFLCSLPKTLLTRPDFKCFWRARFDPIWVSESSRLPPRSNLRMHQYYSTANTF